MSKAERLEISLVGKNYTLASQPEESVRVLEVAAQLNSRLQELKQQMPQASDFQLMLLSALKMTDELMQLQEGSTAITPSSPEDQVLLTAAVHHLTNRIDRIAEQLKAA